MASLIAMDRKRDAGVVQGTLEHPRAEEIRRQVEHYFSDENLATDKHLKALMCGSRNLPVSIGQILGWKRMRHFKPKKQAIEALKKCSTLRVIDNSRIQRLIPYTDLHEADTSGIATIPGTSSATSAANSGMKEGYEVRNGVVALIEPKKKVVTGFEDGYTEGPLSPAQQAELETIYHSDIPISIRLEIAMYRFVSRRKFDNVLRSTFDRFLRFGGIKVESSGFRGDKRDLEDAEALYVAHILGQHTTPRDAEDSDKFEVDFLGIAQCYLGDSALNELSNPELTATCKVMANFYNYLLTHNVCKEYTEQILAARALCTDLSLSYLLSAKEALVSLPGPFNNACKSLFNKRLVQTEWVDISSTVNSDVNFELERAKITALNAVMALGSEDLVSLIAQHKDTWHHECSCDISVNIGIEVIKIEYPSQKTLEVYAGVDGSRIKSLPLGVTKCRQWGVDVVSYCDLPKGNGQLTGTCPDVLELWIEGTIQQNLQVGTKICCDLGMVRFKNGFQLCFLTQVYNLYSPFYRPTFNELMAGGRSKCIRWRLSIPDYINDQFEPGEHIPPTA